MRPGRKKRQWIEAVVRKPSNPCGQLELLSRGFTPQWWPSTLSSTHLLFPQKRRFTFQIPSPIGESCSLVHILVLLFAAHTQDSRKKNNPRHREIQKLASQQGRCTAPKTTGRCEINKAEFIECFTLPTRDPRFKPQHQEKASEMIISVSGLLK